MKEQEQGITNEKSALEDFAKKYTIDGEAGKQISKRRTIITQYRTYFQSKTYTNLEATDVKEILSKMIKDILNKIATYQLSTQSSITSCSVLKFTLSITNQ